MKDESKKGENGPFSVLLMVVVGLFVVAVFLGFFVLWANEGWSAATKKNPAGGALFFIVLGLAYLIAIPLLRDKGYKSASNALLWIALAAGGIALLGIFPSCGDSSEYQIDRPYRK